MSITSETLEAYMQSPSRMEREVLDAIASASDEDVYFSTSGLPIVNLVESNVLTTVAAINELAKIQQSMFSSMARTWSDLYDHLTDTDYINLYATPSKTTSEGIELYISTVELASKSVATTNSDVNQLTIPKHSKFTVGDLTFTLEYPIVISINTQGTVSAIYDVSEESSIQTLDNNQVTASFTTQQDDKGRSFEFLALSIEMYQYAVSVSYMDVDSSSTLKTTISYTNQFYYLEAYMYDSTTMTWTRISTTHSRKVLPVSEPTVVLEVYEDSVVAALPRQYVNNGLVTGRIKFKLYSTRGAITRSLLDYDASQNGMQIGGDDYEATVYTAPMETINDYFVISSADISGGTNAKTFSEVSEILSNRSIDDNTKPITDAQLSTALENEGYKITPYIDLLTSRVYLATRTLPDPVGLRFTSPVDSRVASYSFTMSDLAEHSEVYDNSKRITLKPSAIFSLTESTVRLMTNSELAAYTEDMDDDTLTRLSDMNILRTPFHYVIDSSDDLFDTRAYHLADPGVGSRDYVGTNQNLGLAMQVNEVTIEQSDTGYSMYVSTVSDTTIHHLDDTQEIHAQLGFIPTSAVSRAYITGTLVGTDEDGEFVYRFDLPCNFDIDRDDNLYLNDVTLLGSETDFVPCSLEHTFSISFSITGYGVSGTGESSLVDAYVNKDIISGTPYSISAEEFEISFGERVTNLWDGARSYEGKTTYQRYTTDKPKVYLTDQYERDEDGFIVKGYDEDTGEPIYTITALAGDQVVINGEPQYEYRVGDIVYDNDGNAVVDELADVERQVDLLFLDARMNYTTDGLILPYMVNVPRRIMEWVNNDLADISDALIDNSKLLFHPTDTMGKVSVTIDSEEAGHIDAEQTLSVRFYLSGTANTDIDLQAYLKEIATATVAEHIAKDVISRDAIAADIKSASSDDVVSVKVYGLGGDLDADVITIEESIRRCSMAKKLERLTNGTITMKDALTVEFLKHR